MTGKCHVLSDRYLFCALWHSSLHLNLSRSGFRRFSKMNKQFSILVSIFFLVSTATAGGNGGTHSLEPIQFDTPTARKLIDEDLWLRRSDLLRGTSGSLEYLRTGRAQKNYDQLNQEGISIDVVKRSLKRFHLTDMSVQSPKPPFLVRLRLQVYLPSQILQTNGRLYHLVPASQCCRKIVNSRVPLLLGRYPGSSLIRTHPPPSRLSIYFPLFTVIKSTLLQGFLPGTRRASPVARYVLATVLSLPPRRSE